MVNIGKVLKDEIQRLARQELKSIVEPLRREIADLKRVLAEHTRIMARSGRVDPAPAPDSYPRGKTSAVPASVQPRKRITGKMIRRLRQQLDLSQADFARLVGVSVHSVRNWERKAEQLRLLGNTPQAILEAAGMGREEARRRLGKPADPASSQPSDDHAEKVAARKPGKPPSPAPEHTLAETPITGKMIRQHRERLGLSQAKFARLVGVSTQSVGAWEKRTGPTRFRPDTLAALIQVIHPEVPERSGRSEEVVEQASPKPIQGRRRNAAASTSATTGKRKLGRPRKHVDEDDKGMIDDTPVTAEMIRHHRERLRLTQGGLAKLLGVHLRSVYQWEHKPGVLQFMGDTKKALLKIMALSTGQAQRRLQAMEQRTPASGDTERPEAAKVRSPKPAKKPRSVVQEPEAGRITGHSIRNLRQRLSISQADFARLVGVHTHTISQWERKPGLLRFRGKIEDAVLAVREMTPMDIETKLESLKRIPETGRATRRIGRSKATVDDAHVPRVQSLQDAVSTAPAAISPETPTYPPVDAESEAGNNAATDGQRGTRPPNARGYDQRRHAGRPCCPGPMGMTHLPESRSGPCASGWGSRKPILPGCSASTRRRSTSGNTNLDRSNSAATQRTLSWRFRK